MKKSHIRFLFMLNSCVVGTAVTAQQNASPVSPAAVASEPASLDEIILLARTQPIPMEKAPKGCAVKHVTRYCRPDGRPIKSFNVLEQKTSGLSSAAEPRIESGCLAVEMTLAVPASKKEPDMCEGGEAKVSLKLEVSAR